MFYVYLRGLVVFLLWVVNGNAHYHNEDRILDKSENYILVAPHRTFGILFTWHLLHVQSNLFLWQKRALHQSFICLVD